MEEGWEAGNVVSYQQAGATRRKGQAGRVPPLRLRCTQARGPGLLVDRSHPVFGGDTSPQSRPCWPHRAIVQDNLCQAPDLTPALGLGHLGVPTRRSQDREGGWQIIQGSWQQSPPHRSLAAPW